MMSLVTRRLCRVLAHASPRDSRTAGTVCPTSQDQGVKKQPCDYRSQRVTRQSKSTNRITCTLIPGDGVGPELVHSVQQVFTAGGMPVDFETIIFSELNYGASAKLAAVVKSIKRNQCCLMGTLAPEINVSRIDEVEPLNLQLRKALDLFANVVHVKSLPNVKSRHTKVDFVAIREQTEGEYSFLEHESVRGVVESLKIITATKSKRIAKFAFDYAVKNGRKKVTAVHKANIMKLGDGLFLNCCKEISKYYPRIKFEAMIVDNCTMQLVAEPQQFDVLVLPNLYGNIIDNAGAALVGGAGVVAGASYSARCAVFQPGARHTYECAAGRDIANPTAMLRAAANMLAHVNLEAYSKMLTCAIGKVLAEGKVRTKDIGGNSTTQEYSRAVISKLFT